MRLTLEEHSLCEKKSLIRPVASTSTPVGALESAFQDLIYGSQANPNPFDHEIKTPKSDHGH